MTGANDANLFPDLANVTVPLDQALSVMRQPVQPPADPAAFQDAVQQSHVRANLPNFFNSFMDTLAQHKQEQQQQQADVEQNIQSVQQDQQAAEQQQQQVTDAQNAAIAQQQAAASAPTAAAEVPASTAPAGNPLLPPPDADPFAEEKAAGDYGQQQLDQGTALAERKFAAGLPLPVPEAAPGAAVTPFEQRVAAGLLSAPGAVPLNESDTRLHDVYAAAGRPDPSINSGPLPGSPAAAVRGVVDRYVPGSVRDIPDAILRPITDVGGALGKGYVEAAQGVNNIPYVGPALNPLPSIAREAGLSDEEQQNIGEKVGQFAAPSVADILTGGALTPIFGLQAANAAATVGQQYASGDISGRDALVQLAKLSPQLLPVVLHGIGAVSDFARSDAGRNVLSSLGEERGGAAIATGEPVVAAAPSGLDDLLANKADVRSLSGADLTREATNRGLIRSPEQLAIDRGEIQPGEQLMYHGSAGPIEGALAPTTFLTSDPATAQKYGEIDARMRGVSPDQVQVHAFAIPAGGLVDVEGAHIPALDGSEIKRLASGVEARPVTAAAPLGAGAPPASPPTRPLTPYDVAPGERGAITPGQPKETTANSGQLPGVKWEGEAAAPVEAPATTTSPKEAVATNAVQQGFPPDSAQLLSSTASRQADLGNHDLATAVENVVKPMSDGEAVNAIMTHLSGSGSGGTGTPRSTASVKALPPAQTSRMPAFNKFIREGERQFGVEVGDPKPIRDAVTNVNRKLAAAMTNANYIGTQFAARIKTLGDFTPDTANMPDTATAYLRVHPDAATALAIANPWQFKLTPVQEKFINDFVSITDAAKKAAQKAGVKVGEQGDDTNYFMRHTLEANGQPIVTNAGSFTHGRTAGTLDEALASGNNYVLDPALALQAHLESLGMAQAQSDILLQVSKMKNFDGKGPALWYGAKGGRDGYSVVDNMGKETRGRQWQARDGRVHELLTNTFSTGLPDGFRALTAPSRISRSLEFSIGAFHAGYANAALAFTDLPTFLRTVPSEFARTTTEAGRAAQREEDLSHSLLFQNVGGQLSNTDKFGAGRRVIRQVTTPESESILNTHVTVGGKSIPVAPGLGALSQASHTWLFEGVVPKVQIAAFKSGIRWIAGHKPDLVPDDFDTVMASKDNGQISAMLDRNPEYKAQLEKVAARANHSMGFAESTLGAGERGLSQGLFNTPTITRAIAANVRDLFLPPGNVQGALARRWWVNATADFGAIAVGGTLLAFNGDFNRAHAAGYLDPTSSKFILNPNNGKYFMGIALPSGTTVNLMPSPVRTPLRIMLSPFVTGAEDVRSGEQNPGQVAADIGKQAVAGQGSYLGGVGGFYNTRLSAGLRGAGNVAAAIKSGKPQDALAVGKEFGTGAVPLPVSNFVKSPPSSLEDLKTQGIATAGTFGGANIQQATDYDNLNNYLLSQKNADGSPRFPLGYSTVKTTTNGLATFLTQDPQAKGLVDAYEQHRAAAGTPASQAALATQQQRDQKLQEAATTLSASSDPYKFINYRNTVTKIRSDAAAAEKATALSTATTDPQRLMINSWYDLYNSATDQTGVLHTDDFTDPVTGQEAPGLDNLQAQWKQQNPGQYDSLIKPAYEGSVSQTLPDGSPNPEAQLRADRDTITAAGWWGTTPQAWQQTQQAATGRIPGVDMAAFQNATAYSKARFSFYEQQAAQRGYDPDAANELAKIFVARDPVMAVFSKYRTNDRLRLLQKDPSLLAILNRWGYTNPTKKEVAAITSSAPTQ